MGLAEHHPDKVKGKNKGVLNMSKGSLHDFAATKEKGLPDKVKKPKHKKKTGSKFAGGGMKFA